MPNESRRSTTSRFRYLRSRLRAAALETGIGYRYYLKSNLGVSKPKGKPRAPWHNAVLSTQVEVENAVEQAKRLGLPLHADAPKNWDTLAALDCILNRTGSRTNILDAGAELYSQLLPSLFLYGYRHLYGINLAFQKPVKLGSIRYEYGDITRTRFGDDSLDAISCLSVIEHGVNLRAYFQEMARILKPGGVLITSTDYFETPTDTRGRVAYGVPIHVFSREEIVNALNVASEYGMELTGPLDLKSTERVVPWREFSLHYTFLIFTMQKRSSW